MGDYYREFLNVPLTQNPKRLLNKYYYYNKDVFGKEW